MHRPRRQSGIRSQQQAFLCQRAKYSAASGLAAKIEVHYGENRTYFCAIDSRSRRALEKVLANGEVDIRELVVSKLMTREPRDYQKAGVTAIAAQQLFGSGVKLRPGQNIEYIITDSEDHVPNDRVRAYALWEGWFGYDRKKYAAMLREALEPFVLCVPNRAQPVLLRAFSSLLRPSYIPSLNRALTNEPQSDPMNHGHQGKSHS